MDLEAQLNILLGIVLVVFISLGIPVAFAVAGSALYVAVLGHFLGVFNLSELSFVPNRIFGIVENITLMAVPLFIFMGIMLDKSDLAKDLLINLEQLFKRVRGGILVSVVLVGALLAASTGIVGATIVTISVLVLPTLIENNYDIRVSCGTVAAAGTLGQIIPPSIVLVVLAEMMNVDVGDVFLGAIVPGLLLVAFYIVYILLFVPARQPAVESSDGNSKINVSDLVLSVIPPVILMVVVLGSIFAGIASPSEASACGAVGATLLALLKGKLSVKVLRDVTVETGKLVGMIYLLIIAAQMLSVVFRGLYGDEYVTELIELLEFNPHVIFAVVMLIIFVLGFFLDCFEIAFIVLPIVAPIFSSLGYDPLWSTIMVAVNLQTSFLTPPFGYALFYLKGSAPPSVTTADIYQGVIPFVVIQLLVLVLLGFFPQLILYIPHHVL